MWAQDSLQKCGANVKTHATCIHMYLYIGHILRYTVCCKHKNIQIYSIVNLNFSLCSD